MVIACSVNCLFCVIENVWVQSEMDTLAAFFQKEVSYFVQWDINYVMDFCCIRWWPNRLWWTQWSPSLDCSSFLCPLLRALYRYYKCTWWAHTFICLVLLSQLVRIIFPCHFPYFIKCVLPLPLRILPLVPCGDCGCVWSSPRTPPSGTLPLLLGIKESYSARNWSYLWVGRIYTHTHVNNRTENWFEHTHMYAITSF